MAEIDPVRKAERPQHLHPGGLGGVVEELDPEPLLRIVEGENGAEAALDDVRRLVNEATWTATTGHGLLAAGARRRVETTPAMYSIV